MEILRQFWTVESFRGAVIALLGLSQDEMQRLAAVEIPTSLSEEETRKLGIGTISLDALYTLRNIGADEGWDAKEAAEEISRLAEFEPESMEALAALIRPTESFIRTKHFQQVQNSIFPALVSSRTETDFRVTTDPITDDTVVLPLVSVRLMFDEEIGGSRSISFQINAEALEDFLDDLQKAKTNLATARLAMPNQPVE